VTFTRRRFLETTALAGAAACLPSGAAAWWQAGRPRPTAAQLAWQRDELAMFIHFGVNTFSDREWGDGKELPSSFAPSKLDARQWARAAKQAGFRAMILTAKHHDGFCLWPTRTTTHSVAASPFRAGAGGQLVLPVGWVPAGTTTTMPTLAADLASVPLKTERDRLGVKFSLVPSANWELTGHFRREEKDGTKDVGATFSFDRGVILPAPVSYQTDDFGIAMGYKGERLQARMGYTGSMFKNDYARIGWDNPYATGPATGQMAEAPDNQFHQIDALLGYQLSETTRLGAKLALGRMTQDEAFLPYGTTSGLPATTHLDGEVNTTLAKFDLNSRPSSRLRLDASYTYSDRDNNTPVNTYNYVITDLAPSPDARQNRPYSFEQQLLRLKAGYRLPKGADLSGGFDYDRMDRTYQQVTETDDKTLWASLKLRPTDSVEAGLKISHASRDASPYNAAAFQNPSFPESGAVPGEPLMQAFEMADRTRDKVGLDVSYNPQEKLSLGFAVDYYSDDYDNMVLGLTEATGYNLTPSLTYVFREGLTASAYYTYERLDSEQAGRAWIHGVSTSWLESDKNLTQTVGFSLNWVAIPKKLDIGADLVHADYTGEMRYAGVGATDLPEVSATLTGVGVHGVYKLKDNLALRAGYRYERYKESDWAKSGAVDSVATLLSLGEAPQDYDTHLVTLSLRYEFK